ncbi:hypothetical protein KIN20_026558 [Parelaphostrongylus tenuis]|uniref:Uncharacterized protein n=1 Tax=Parelaphostrongylus tenuis TaxID=148309 RepID=A0AAD5QY63_PARTN|nr:hypothetical protein KIN20_026558 [Parelaphostrongylus tenuis]
MIEFNRETSDYVNEFFAEARDDEHNNLDTVIDSMLLHSRRDREDKSANTFVEDRY